MAAPGGKFYIQDVIKDVAPHHESFEKLWETKWKGPVSFPSSRLQHHPTTKLEYSYLTQTC
jgi:hypothetical protein